MKRAVGKPFPEFPQIKDSQLPINLSSCRPALQVGGI
jgi:hypothetical protein